MKQIISNPKLKLLILLIIIIIIILINNFSWVDTAMIENWFKPISLPLAIAIFIFLYVVGTFFIWYLKDILKLIGAILFGPYLSTLLICLSETVNAFIFFWLSRILGKDFMEKYLRGNFKNNYENLAKINFGWVFLLRSIPLVPFRILDIIFGLSKISFKKYLLAVILASPPRIFFFQFILAAVKGFSLEKISIFTAKNPIIFLITFLYIGLSCLVAFTIRKKLK